MTYLRQVRRPIWFDLPKCWSPGRVYRRYAIVQMEIKTLPAVPAPSRAAESLGRCGYKRPRHGKASMFTRSWTITPHTKLGFLGGGRGTALPRSLHTHQRKLAELASRAKRQRESCASNTRAIFTRSVARELGYAARGGREPRGQKLGEVVFRELEVWKHSWSGGLGLTSAEVGGQ